MKQVLLRPEITCFTQDISLTFLFWERMNMKAPDEF